MGRVEKQGAYQHMMRESPIARRDLLDEWEKDLERTLSAIHFHYAKVTPPPSSDAALDEAAALTEGE